MERLCLAFFIIFVFPALGYICAVRAKRDGDPSRSEKLATLRIRLQSSAIFVLMPISALLSLWGLPRPEPNLFILPFLGLAAYVWGGLLSFGCARIMGMTAEQTGGFYCCGTFSNIGAVGSLVCLIFLGENTIALVALYRILEEIFYFGVSFPIAGAFSSRSRENNFVVKKSRVYPALAAIVAGLAAGLWLNYAGVARPAMMGVIASVAMFAATMILLFAIGMTLRVSSVWRYRGAGLVMCGIKFAGVPVAVTSLAWLLGLGDYDGGLIIKTVAILSSMPVAMTALVPPSLFGLDTDLANACWIITTAGLILVLPALIGILPFI
ncbi:MAG: hypothetical protein K2H64_08035 [Desulfovibrio sp.]|nr:hypothetical protein [Desulfovibrio sp.]